MLNNHMLFVMSVNLLNWTVVPNRYGENSPLTTLSLVGFLNMPTASLMDGWMNQAYSRLSTTHGHITD